MLLRHDLIEERWTRREPLLPRSRRGPQPRDVRRTINRLKQFPRSASRYEKLAVDVQSMVTLAAPLTWL
jgi:transposase